MNGSNGEGMAFFAPCFGGEGGEGFAGYPVWAGGMMPMQQFWYAGTGEQEEDGEAAPT